ncbi:hypothetical protein BJ742DRAFT_307792 [Cladochytrium replicatum]|nr:hypothetical protein BJ742DRAFT_307792 [Cladochytrium replicatum]
MESMGYYRIMVVISDLSHIRSTLKNYIVQLLICRLEFPASTTQNSYVPPPPVVSVEQPPSNPQCTVNMITNILHQNQAARQLFNLVDKCHFSRNSLVTPIALARFYSPRSQTILADFKMEIDARTRRLVMGQECNVSSLADRWWVASPQLDENRKKRRKVLMYVVADQNNGAPAYLYSQHLLQADHVCTVNGVQAWAPYNGRPLMDSWADITHGFRGAFALIEKGSDLPVSVTVKMQRLRQSYYHGGNSTISGTVCILCVDEVDVDETLLILYEGKLKQRGITLGIFEGLESGTPQWSREFWRPSPCAYTMENERFPVEPCILSSDGKDLLPRFVDRYLNALKLEAEIKTVVAGVSVSDDLELGDEIVQFKDPVSLGRMECAVKGKGCSHKACFDARTFITLNETTPRWRCPVCRGNVKLDELQLDDRVTLLLDKYRDHDHCIVHPDGSDSPPKSKEGPFQSQGGNGDVGGIVVGYTTFDDEETEAEEEEDQQVRKRRRKVLAVIELDDDDGDMYVSPPTKKVAAEASGTMIGSAGNIIPVYEID